MAATPPSVPVLATLLLSVGCGAAGGAGSGKATRGPAQAATQPSDPARARAAYRSAEAHVVSGDLGEALAALVRALDAGYATPSDVLATTTLRPLRDDPATREALREVLAEHARESDITMVDSAEPGTPLDLEIRVVDAEDGEPLPGVQVLLVHVDDRGLYQPSDLDQQLVGWNPRLFGHCVTDATGTVRARTIRPAHYHPQYDAAEPAHVHFTITKPGHRTWGGEIVFDDDARVDAATRAEAARVGTPVARPVRTGDGGRRVTVTLRMQPDD